jgi:hypothetical protein
MLEALAASYREHGRLASTHYSTLAGDLGLERDFAFVVIFQLSEDRDEGACARLSKLLAPF